MAEFHAGKGSSLNHFAVDDRSGSDSSPGKNSDETVRSLSRPKFIFCENASVDIVAKRSGEFSVIRFL